MRPRGEPPDLPPPPPSRPEPDEGAAGRAPWRFWEFFPVLLLAAFIGGLGVAGAEAVLDSCGARRVAEALIGEIGFAVAVVGWILARHPGRLAALGLPGRPLGDLGAGVLAGLGLTVVGWVSAFVVVTVVRAVTGETPPQPEQIDRCIQGNALVLSGLVVTMVAPVAEEVVFRGFLHRGLRRSLSPWFAIPISSALFAAIHVHPIVIFAIFPVGIGLAVLYERRGSLLAPIAAHAVFNLVGFLTIVAGRS